MLAHTSRIEGKKLASKRIFCVTSLRYYELKLCEYQKRHVALKFKPYIYINPTYEQNKKLIFQRFTMFLFMNTVSSPQAIIFPKHLTPWALPSFIPVCCARSKKNARYTGGNQPFAVRSRLI